MPVYNAGEYLQEAIDSLLNQTFTNFEVIAIDDGSTDSSGDILNKIAQEDSRFRVIHQANKGLVPTLNYAVSISNAPLIARMDADDISVDTRFEREVALFSDEKVVLVVGGYAEIGNIRRTRTPPSRPESIIRSLYIQNYLGHGTVMFRKTAFNEVGGYSTKVGPVEDYDLWIRLSQKGLVASTSETVYLWRVNNQGITSTQNHHQEECATSLRENLWQEAPEPLRPIALRDKSWSPIDLEIEARLYIHFLRRQHFKAASSQLLALLSSPKSVFALARQIGRIIRGKL